ncbi:MAG: TauD/TfdA family dioxygenase, partial [Microcoleus sp. SIO2G3]|nr:TauD/TfdA family dioxygenase [Microcoleus sp. SIO2G3]
MKNNIKFGAVRRKPVNISEEQLVNLELLKPGQLLPLVIQPAVEGLSLIAWADSHREWIEAQLLKHGGILFRNFNVKGTNEFEQFIQTISGTLLDYSYRSTPRHQVSGKIYTSTEYPAS